VLVPKKCFHYFGDPVVPRFHFGFIATQHISHFFVSYSRSAQRFGFLLAAEKRRLKGVGMRLSQIQLEGKHTMANIKEALKVLEDVIATGHKAVKELRTQQAAAEGQGVGELVAVMAAALDSHLSTALTMRAAYEGLIAASDMTSFSEPKPEVVSSTIAAISARETSMGQSAQKLEAAQKAVVALQTKATDKAKEAKDSLTKLLPPSPTPPPAPKNDKPTAPAGDGKGGSEQPNKPAPAGDGKPGDKPGEKKRGFFS
jgi:hypothetical protein